MKTLTHRIRQKPFDGLFVGNGQLFGSPVQRTLNITKLVVIELDTFLFFFFFC